MRRRLLVVALLLLFVPSALPEPDRPARIVATAYAMIGMFPYSWGGGHARDSGPSRGTCHGYRGRIKPCPARKTVGLDCSGLARWVYEIAYGRDVLGPGNTDAHLKRMRRVKLPKAGDLVFFGTRKRTHHVGVYVGRGLMVNAFATGTRVRLDRVDVLKDRVGFYRI